MSVVVSFGGRPQLSLRAFCHISGGGPFMARRVTTYAFRRGFPASVSAREPAGRPVPGEGGSLLFGLGSAIQAERLPQGGGANDSLGRRSSRRFGRG